LTASGNVARGSRRLIFAIALLASGAAACSANRLVPPSDPRIAVMGRVDRSDPSRLRFGYPGVTLRLAFEGPSLAARFTGTTAASRLAVIVDGGAPRVIRLPRGDSEVALADGLAPGPHTIEIVHRTETWQGMVAVRGFVLGPGGRMLEGRPALARRILFIGDSVTCGEAIDREPPPTCRHDPPASSNAFLSYGMLLGRALGAEVHLVCYGGRGLIRDWRGNRRVANAPQLYELAVPDPPWRSGWDHAAFVPDAVVVSLGSNDFNLDLGAFPEREEYVSAYVGFVRAIRLRAPRAHLFLTEGAIVSDETDPRRPQKTVLREYLAETARRLTDPRVHVVESRHYPGDACNAHPTGAQHAEMARDLDPVIRGALGW
jgi:lysophospholipase L1-like esterase